MIKKSISERLGGPLFDEVWRMLSLKKPHASEGRLKAALYKKRKPLLVTYFFTAPMAEGLFDAYYENLYEELCAVYTDRTDETRFDFDGIIIPKPERNNYKKTIAGEFQDLLCYYLLDDIEFCNAVTCEGPYEFGEVSVSSDDIVIDCGANLGLFSAVASSKGAVVHAFEPNKHIIREILSKTSKYNPNIKIHEVALSDKHEQTIFWGSADNIGVGQIDMVSHGPKRTHNEKMIVQATTLDDFVKSENLPRVDFIKADIEGAERYMLKGARQVLKEFSPKLAICTYHGLDEPKVIRKLILDANPDYIIEQQPRKLYAHVP